MFLLCHFQLRLKPILVDCKQCIHPKSDWGLDMMSSAHFIDSMVMTPECSNEISTQSDYRKAHFWTTISQFFFAFRMISSVSYIACVLQYQRFTGNQTHFGHLILGPNGLKCVFGLWIVNHELRAWKLLLKVVQLSL